MLPTAPALYGQGAGAEAHVLKDEYKTLDLQLFLAERGFGCSPTAQGRKIYGRFLKDGEETHHERQDSLGVPKDEHLPDWAMEKLAEIHNVFAKFNTDVHSLHRGHSLSVSDVELTEDGVFFCDIIGFKKIEFDESKAYKPDNLLTIVYVEPNLS